MIRIQIKLSGKNSKDSVLMTISCPLLYLVYQSALSTLSDLEQRMCLDGQTTHLQHQ